MSLLKRMSDLIRSNVNDVLDKAEDPRKILEQTILDMEAEHKKAKKMLLDTLTLLKQSERQASAHRDKSAEWEDKAMAALRAGQEELARQALGEKAKVEELHAETERGVLQQRTYTEELKRSLAQLEAKIDDARQKRDELVARINAAEMKKKQAQIRTGTSDGSDALRDATAFDTFDRMVAKIENSEAEIEAHRELSGAVAADQEAELDRQLKAQGADAALEALKARMVQSSAPTPVATTPNVAPSDPKAKAIEDELSALRARLASGPDA